MDNLVCPVEKLPLEYSEGYLYSSSNKRYPVVDGIPVMLVEDAEQTIGIASESIRLAKRGRDIIDDENHDLYIESLGINEEEKHILWGLVESGQSRIDPVVSMLVGATNGIAYKNLIGKINKYPIPDIRLPVSNNEKLLDIGCNWGRWSISAAKKGYEVVGIDPSLGAVMAARRVANQLGLHNARFVVGDARYLPFREGLFDIVFSYSVLQHLAKKDAKQALSEVNRVLVSQGKSIIQMPNKYGIRCLQHQLKRGFREARDFEVRYWGPNELISTFGDIVGRPSKLSVDCYFGLGLQESDIDLMSNSMKYLIKISHTLRRISSVFIPLKWVADSLYVQSHKS